MKKNFLVISGLVAAITSAALWVENEMSQGVTAFAMTPQPIPDGDVMTKPSGSAASTQTASVPQGTDAADRASVSTASTFTSSLETRGVVVTALPVIDIPVANEGAPAAGTRAIDNTFFQAPSGITVDAQGNLYVTDRARHLVRQVIGVSGVGVSGATPAGVVGTIAGSSGASGSNDGTGTGAKLNAPKGIRAFGSMVYVADSGNSKLRSVNTFSGATTTLASVAGESLGVDAQGNSFVADSAGKTVRKVTTAGAVSTVASLATSTTSGQGKVETFVLTGDIDPVKPALRYCNNPIPASRFPLDQSAGLAPVTVVSGLHGVRLELNATAPMEMNYTATDFPKNEYEWFSHVLPFTATYPTQWVLPLFPYHDDPIEVMAGFFDNQMWEGGLTAWIKVGPNSVVINQGACGSPEVIFMERFINLTFTTPNSGTFVMQVGPLIPLYIPGITQLSKVVGTCSGSFVLNRIAQKQPDSTPQFGKGFWVE